MTASAAEGMARLSPEKGAALASIAAGLSLGLNWEYNHQSVKQALATHLPEVELAIWWPTPEGFSPITEGAAERFGEWAGAHQLENIWQETAMRTLPELPGAQVAGIVSNRQTFGLAVASGPDAELVQAALKILMPQLGLARLGTTLSEEVSKRTSTDKITGLWNRQYFNERFREECERLVRSKESGAVAIVGLDNFGALAKTMGAEEVNGLYSLVGQTVRQVIRQTDWAVRWDTNELLFYFPSTPADAALEVLKRFGKRLLGSHAILEPLIGLSSTVETTSPRALIQLATRRLDLARKDGNRRVICYATPAHGLQFWRGEAT